MTNLTRVSSLLLLSLVSAFAQTGRTVVLTWSNPAANPSDSKYNVYRLTGDCPAVQPADTSLFNKLTATPIPDKTYTDPVANGKYCYVVTAVAANLESVPSNTASAVANPKPPTDLNITVQVDVSVNVGSITGQGVRSAITQHQ